VTRHILLVLAQWAPVKPCDQLAAKLAARSAADGAAMNHYNVVTRLLEILRLVRAGDYPSSNHMAAATGVGWRTIQRDLDFLRQLRVWQRFRSEFSTSLI
jgi:hypothetical protein